LTYQQPAYLCRTELLNLFATHYQSRRRYPGSGGLPLMTSQCRRASVTRSEPAASGVTVQMLPLQGLSVSALSRLRVRFTQALRGVAAAGFVVVVGWCGNKWATGDSRHRSLARKVPANEVVPPTEFESVPRA
jgi:hypothetical protein